MESFIGLIFTFALQLFILVDPVAAIPVFLAITPDNSAAERRHMAVRGCLVAFLTVSFFILLGPLLFDYFGISSAAVRICGGILLFAIALEMLYGRFTGTVSSQREERLAEEKEDVSITPLAIPVLAGPGAITTALIFAGRATSVWSYLALFLGCGLVFSISFLLLRRAQFMVRYLGKLGMTILVRILGLVLAFLAVQYVVDGIQKAFDF